MNGQRKKAQRSTSGSKGRHLRLDKQGYRIYQIRDKVTRLDSALNFLPVSSLLYSKSWHTNSEWMSRKDPSDFHHIVYIKTPNMNTREQQGQGTENETSSSESINEPYATKSDYERTAETVEMIQKTAIDAFINGNKGERGSRGGGVLRPPLNRPSRYFDPASPALRSISTLVSVPSMSVPSKAFEAYQMERTFTYYSEATDVLQSDILNNLSTTQTLSELISKNGFFWLDVTRPSAMDMNKLAEIFSIHPLTIEDIQVRDNREKCEIFEKYLFICIRTCDQRHTASSSAIEQGSNNGAIIHGLLVEPVNLYMIVFGDFIMTIHAEPIPHIRHVLRRNYPLRSLFKLTSDWIAYALLDDVVDEFMPNMRTMELEVDSIDDLVLILSHTDQSDMLRRIGRARKRVTHLLRLLQPKTEVIKALTKRCPDRLAPHTLLYLRDIQDHVITMIQNFDHYSETLNRSHSNYLAQISIELNKASNHMSIVMKKLTAAAAILLPLSLISGIWGMNVPVPGGGEFSENFIPFLSILVFMLTVVLIMFVIGRRQDWF